MNLWGFLLPLPSCARPELRCMYPTNQVAVATPVTNPQLGSWFTGLAQVT